MTEKYDSTEDTKQHIDKVRFYLQICVDELKSRAFLHDESKLETPEKEAFDEYTPKLKAMTYGSEEYKACLNGLKVALDHHYANNTHHPEYYGNGIHGMSLFDILEMLMDWKAAGERHADGSITRSLEINQKRFGIDEQLQSILKNTAKEMGWI